MIAKAMFDKEGSKRVINALKLVESLKNTINLVVSEDGLKFIVLDRSHISFAILELKPEHFKCNSDEEMIFLPDCEDLRRVLAAYRNGRELFITVDENYLTLQYANDVNEIEFKLQFGTLEKYDKVPAAPKIEWPAKFTLPVKDLKDAVCAANSISDKLYFKSSGETDHILTCYAEVYENGNETPNLSMKASFQTDTDYKEKVWGVYQTLRVNSLLSSRTTFSDEVTLGLDVDMPLLLIFDYEGVGQLKLLTTPRIESEE